MESRKKNERAIRTCLWLSSICSHQRRLRIWLSALCISPSSRAAGLRWEWFIQCERAANFTWQINLGVQIPKNRSLTWGLQKITAFTYYNVSIVGGPASFRVASLNYPSYWTIHRLLECTWQLILWRGSEFSCDETRAQFSKMQKMSVDEFLISFARCFGLSSSGPPPWTFKSRSMLKTLLFQQPADASQSSRSTTGRQKLTKWFVGNAFVSQYRFPCSPSYCALSVQKWFFISNILWTSASSRVCVCVCPRGFVSSRACYGQSCDSEPSAWGSRFYSGGLALSRQGWLTETGRARHP